MWLDKESDVDLIAYKPFIQLVVSILEDEEMTPLTIGLYGSWGAGKSTILNLIAESIKGKSQGVKSLKINAWEFEGYEDAKTALMESLLLGIEEEYVDRNDDYENGIGKKIKSLLSKINWLKLTGTLLKAGSAGLMEGVVNKWGGVAKAVEVFGEDLPKFVNKSEDSTLTTAKIIREFRKEFSELILELKIKNLVIMIDDLDRCSPERIIQTLEAIKLFLSVPKVTFILALDDKVIRYALNTKYDEMMEDGTKFSENYMEKVIQVPLSIPELSETDIKNYLALLVCEKYLSSDAMGTLLKSIDEEKIFITGMRISKTYIEKNVGTLSDEFNKVFDPIYKVGDVLAGTLKGNPRQAKRFLNTFILRYKLGEIIQFEGELDLEILAKLMTLEYMSKDLYRQLYKWYQSHPNEGVFEIKEMIQTLDDDNDLSEYGEWNEPQYRRWLETEPIDLSNDLEQYFYITRDSLNVQISIYEDLNGIERKIYREVLESPTPSKRRSNIYRGFDSIDLTSQARIVTAFIKNIDSNNFTILSILCDIYRSGKYSNHNERIISTIEQLSEEVIKDSKIQALIGGTLKLDQNLKERVLHSYKEQRIDDEIVEKIKKVSEVGGGK